MPPELFKCTLIPTRAQSLSWPEFNLLSPQYMLLEDKLECASLNGLTREHVLKYLHPRTQARVMCIYAHTDRLTHTRASTHATSTSNKER